MCRRTLQVQPGLAHSPVFLSVLGQGYETNSKSNPRQPVVKLRWRHGSAERVTKTCFSYNAACLAKTDTAHPIEAHPSARCRAAPAGGLETCACSYRATWRRRQAEAQVGAAAPQRGLSALPAGVGASSHRGWNFGCLHGASGCQVAVTVVAAASASAAANETCLHGMLSTASTKAKHVEQPPRADK